MLRTSKRSNRAASSTSKTSPITKATKRTKTTTLKTKRCFAPKSSFSDSSQHPLASQIRKFSSESVPSEPTQLSKETLNHLTIDQYNQLRVQDKITYESDVVIQGWVRSIRNQGSVAFVTLNDGSNVHGVQAIIDPLWSQQSISDLLNNYSIPLGSAVRIKGKLARNERKPHESPEGWEVRAHQLEIEGICDTTGYLPKLAEVVPAPPTEQTDGEVKKDKKQKKAELAAAKLKKEQEELQLAKRVSQLPELEEYSLAPYPLQKKFQTLDFLRQHPDTRLRTNTYAAIARVRSASMVALHNHFASNDFVCVQPPVLTPSDCEGGGEMFQVERTDKLNAVTAEKHVLSSTPSETPGVNKEDYFFHRPAYLSVSGQLYAEIAASALRRVYSFGPTFRAENSHTSRHLAEFWMLEPEMAFTSLDELCTACEASIQGTIQSLLKNPTTLQDLQFFEGRVDPDLTTRLRHVSSTPFGRITYTDAIELLNKDIGEKKVEFKVNGLNWGDDLGTEHEKYLAEQVFQRPVFVTNYPAKIKPFYMKVDDDSLLASFTPANDEEKDGIVTPRSKSISTDLATWSNYSKQAQIQSQQDYDSANPLLKLPTLNNTTDAHTDDITKMTVACFDLLVPGMGELCGGSQREERLEVLLKRVKQYGLPMQEYQWYLDLRRFGTTTHGGWGMGFERFVAYVTGSENVRDTTLVPRAPGLMQI